MTLRERFEAKIDRGGPNGCWLWTGAMDSSGYGIFYTGGDKSGGRRTMQAQRKAYELFVGPIPKGDGFHGICVCHACDNRACVNPMHLFIATHAANMADMAAKGRSRKVGTAGTANGRAKLTPREIRAIRRLKGRLSQSEIGKRFGIVRSHVSNIHNGKRWTCLGDKGNNRETGERI